MASEKAQSFTIHDLLSTEGWKIIMIIMPLKLLGTISQIMFEHLAASINFVCEMVYKFSSFQFQIFIV